MKRCRSEKFIQSEAVDGSFEHVGRKDVKEIVTKR